MVDLSVLNRLFLNRLPIAIEEAIVEIDTGLSNKVVTEQVIEVVCFDLNHRRARELTGEFEELVESGVWLIKLVIVALGVLTVAALDKQVGVAEGANIAGSKVETLEHVELDHTLSLGEQLLLDHLVVASVLEELEEAWVIDVHRG